MSLVLAGLNHKTASVTLREKLAIGEHQLPEALHWCLQQPAVEACVIISTCNRTEFYFWLENDAISGLELLCQKFDLPLPDSRQFLYEKRDDEAVRHLYTVASGMDSLVLGEPQILGQVKAAFDLARQHKALNKRLERLFQNAFHVAKSVRSKTAIGRNPVSVANSAVMLAKQVFGQLTGRSILVVGAGDTAQLVTRYLTRQGFAQLCITNRTQARSQQLAEQVNARVLPFELFPAHLHEFDLVFSATASPEPVIHKSTVENAIRRRKHQPMVMLDLAIPRDIDPAVSELEDVFLYGVDDLQKVVSNNLKSREQAAEQARVIIDMEAEAFSQWLRSQQHLQLIRQFQLDSDKLRQKALLKAQKMLRKGEKPEIALDYLANTLTKTLLHAPVSGLRQAAENGDAATIAAACRLLNLNCENGQPEALPADETRPVENPASTGNQAPQTDSDES